MAVRNTKRSARTMHQTTVRFGKSLWEDLQGAAAREGVSVAQYVREAAIARVYFEAGGRSDAAMAHAIDEATRLREQSAALGEQNAALKAQNVLATNRWRALHDER